MDLNATFQLTPEEMRSVGYKVIDMLIEHQEALPKQPFARSPSNKELSAIIDDQLPINGQDIFKILSHLEQDVLSNLSHTNHPRFFSFVPSPGNFIAAIADTLASGYNVFSGHWLSGPGAAKVELVTINWLLKLCGFPQTGGGLFVSGGSMANLSALATARTVKGHSNPLKNTVYYSQQTHSSLAKGLRILGFLPDQMRPIPIDSSFKIHKGALCEQIEQDRRNGYHPLCLVGNAGTTNTGAVDDLQQLSKIAKTYNLWFHIDGAYGAAAILSKKGKNLLKGMELADSLTLDPHKWWFQPYEIGCLLVQNPQHLKTTFAVTAEYLKDAQDLYHSEINFFNYGTQLTRSFRALKLYTSLKAFGINNFAKAIDHGIAMAEYTELLIRQQQDWKIISPAQLGMLAFKCHPAELNQEESDVLNRKITEFLLVDGYAMIITTTLHNQIVLRMCTIHPAITKEEIETTVEKLIHYAQKSCNLLFRRLI